jgi:dihydroxyacid dehydratase/phosphogluconate dehydratase
VVLLSGCDKTTPPARAGGARRPPGGRDGGPRPGEILTAATFDTIRALMAIGGSTNAVIHLLALAGRAGVPLSLARFEEPPRTTPFLLNVRRASA